MLGISCIALAAITVTTSPYHRARHRRGDTVKRNAVLLEHHAVYAGRRPGGATSIRPILRPQQGLS